MELRVQSRGLLAYLCEHNRCFAPERMQKGCAAIPCRGEIVGCAHVQARGARLPRAALTRHILEILNQRWAADAADATELSRHEGLNNGRGCPGPHVTTG